MGRIFLVLLLVGCRQLFGFVEPQLADGTPADTIDPPITCTGPGSCPDSVPICESNHCRGCASADECASGVCLPGGACADAGDVAYVEQAATGASCTQADPCASVNTAIVTGKPNIKIIGLVTETTSVLFTSGTTSVFGPGRLTRSNMGLILDVQSQAKLSIFDLTIGGAVSSDAVRVNGLSLLLERVNVVNNEGRGIDANVNSSLTMRRCIVVGNSGGGIQAQNAVFQISNTIIAGNGTGLSTFGGLKLKPNPTSTFELNTVADNVSSSANESAIRCDNTFTLDSNIIANNLAGVNCLFDHSLFDTTVRPGTGNVKGAPAFVNTDLTDPTGSTFYRIGPASKAIDGAASAIAIDIDGQLRPNGTAPDIGADEYVP